MSYKDLGTILILFVLPLMLLRFDLISSEYYLYVFAVVVILSIIIAILEKKNLKDLGIRLDNFKQSWLPHLLFTIVAVIGLFIFIKFDGATAVTDWEQNKVFFATFIIISFAQAFLFLSFLFPKLVDNTDSMRIAILINAALFTLMHFMYSDFAQIWGLLFIGGIGFVTIYRYYPNLILAGLSHSILNFVIVFYGYLRYFNN